jgi:trimeric autotransporter adhesin
VLYCSHVQDLQVALGFSTAVSAAATDGGNSSRISTNSSSASGNNHSSSSSSSSTAEHSRISGSTGALSGGSSSWISGISGGTGHAAAVRRALSRLLRGAGSDAPSSSITGSSGNSSVNGSVKGNGSAALSTPQHRLSVPASQENTPVVHEHGGLSSWLPATAGAYALDSRTHGVDSDDEDFNFNQWQFRPTLISVSNPLSTVGRSSAGDTPPVRRAKHQQQQQLADAYSFEEPDISSDFSSESCFDATATTADAGDRSSGRLSEGIASLARNPVTSDSNRSGVPPRSLPAAGSPYYSRDQLNNTSSSSSNSNATGSSNNSSGSGSGSRPWSLQSSTTVSTSANRRRDLPPPLPLARVPSNSSIDIVSSSTGGDGTATLRRRSNTNTSSGDAHQHDTLSIGDLSAAASAATSSSSTPRRNSRGKQQGAARTPGGTVLGFFPGLPGLLTPRGTLKTTSSERFTLLGGDDSGSSDEESGSDSGSSRPVSTTAASTATSTATRDVVEHKMQD